MDSWFVNFLMCTKSCKVSLSNKDKSPMLNPFSTRIRKGCSFELFISKVFIEFTH